MAETKPRRPAKAATQARSRRVRDSGGRERLLDAAIALFSERGISSTTVAQIAAAGRVTSAMVHYWFETREKLLDAVVEERLAPMIHGVWQAVDAERGHVLDLVGSVVSRMLDVTDRLPWLPSLWLREIVQEGGELRERVISRIPRERNVAFRRAVARAQANGEINPEISPELLFISMLALVMLPQATAKVWRRVNPDVAIDRARLERHVMGLIMHGLAGAARPRAAGRARRSS